jgi:hypothetical protein
MVFLTDQPKFSWQFFSRHTPIFISLVVLCILPIEDTVCQKSLHCMTFSPLFEAYHIFPYEMHQPLQVVSVAQSFKKKLEDM